MKTVLFDDKDEGNEIEASFSLSDEILDLTAEWAGDVYGEGQLSLNKEQAVYLARAILSLWG